MKISYGGTNNNIIIQLKFETVYYVLQQKRRKKYMGMW